MSNSILFVNQDPFFLYEMETVLRCELAECEVIAAKDRDSAYKILAERSGDIRYMVMSLMLPRVADGYMLLSEVSGKFIAGRKIAVLAQKVTEQVEHSVRLHGVEHLYSTYDLDKVLLKLHRSLFEPLHNLNVDSKQIKAALTEVVGPIGSFIYDECCETGYGMSNASLLIENIMERLDDKERAAKFYALLTAASEAKRAAVQQAASAKRAAKAPSKMPFFNRRGLRMAGAAA